MLNDAVFQRQLAWGQAGETAIARWLRAGGRSILPIYDIEYDTGKGPRLFCGSQRYAAPDLLVWGDCGMRWIEAKRKTAFTWRRCSTPPFTDDDGHSPGRRNAGWQTGIDLHHWRAYLRVQSITHVPTVLLFLHEKGSPDAIDANQGCPESCPVGLFGGKIERLFHCVGHKSMRHGAHGMIYWYHEDLERFATIQEVEQAGQSSHLPILKGRDAYAR